MSLSGNCCSAANAACRPWYKAVNKLEYCKIRFFTSRMTQIIKVACTNRPSRIQKVQMHHNWLLFVVCLHTWPCGKTSSKSHQCLKCAAKSRHRDIYCASPDCSGMCGRLQEADAHQHAVHVISQLPPLFVGFAVAYGLGHRGKVLCISLRDTNKTSVNLTHKAVQH